MSGHNKWSKIKRQKGASDAQKSKIFGKMVRYISVEAKKAGGNLASPGLKTAIEKAKAVNVPNDTIDRAVKKGATDNSAAMESITYEAYGPGGSALIIDALTDNHNKASQDIKHTLAKNGFSLAGMGAASWAFDKKDGEWIPKTTMPISEEDGAKLAALIDELEENDEVQGVYTNAE
jgi:YebC/PmpR family DNA-binding regulatory protein